MRTYFIYNNVNSNDLNLVIEDRIIYPSSLSNDNNININVFYYDNINRNNHLKIFRELQKLFRYSGELIISEYEEVYFKVKYADINIVERTKNAIRFNIIFNVEQFKYLNNQKIFNNIELSDINSDYEVINEGDNISKPIFIINSIGDITLDINGRITTISDTNGEFILDSELQDCYNNHKLLNNNIKGDFPYLDIGANTINLKGNIESIEVKVNSTIY